MTVSHWPIDEEGVHEFEAAGGKVSRTDLDEAIGVSTDDGDIARLGALVVTRNVLLH